jgi:hypothetical protein
MTPTYSPLDLPDWEAVPRRCAGDGPGVGHGNDNVMNLSAKATTEDQGRIEAALDELLQAGDRVLHVGVGNSSLARRFAPRAGHILGLTLSPAEKSHGDALAIPGYAIRLANKYSADLDAVQGPFRYLIDNNPASFGCCLEHFQDMLANYARLLTPGGRMLTDREGMYWCYANGPMRLRFEHLEAIARVYPFHAERIDEHVFALRRREQ